MTANELRIGNLLYNDGVIVTIDARTIFDIWNNEGLKKYAPVPLTVEWLERMGFKYNDLNGDSGYWQIKHPTAAGLIKILEGSEGDFAYNFQVEIKYIYQLQNLYFALTREELVVVS